MFFNMPNQGLSGISGAMALTSPENAARFLIDCNKSSLPITDADVQFIIASMRKVLDSGRDACNKFLNYWQSNSGVKSGRGYVLMHGSFGAGGDTVNQSTVKNIGNQIWDKANASSDNRSDAQIQADEDALKASYEQGNNLSTGAGVAAEINAAFTDAGLQSGETEAKKMKANGTNINIRELPSSSAKILAKVSNATVSVSSKDPGAGGWTRILYNSKPAFISTNLLAPVGTPNKPTSTGSVSTLPVENPPPELSAGLTVTQKALIVGGVVTVTGLLLFLTRKK